METKSKRLKAQLKAVGIAGYKAFYKGAKHTDNPHNSYLDPKLADAWGKGWLAAEEDNSQDAMRHSPEAQAMLDPGAQNGN